MDTYRWQLAEALQCSSDPIVIYRATLRLLGNFLKVDRVVHLYKDRDGLTIEHEYVAGAGSLRGLYGPHELPECISTERKRVVEDVVTAPDLSEDEREALAKIGVRSFITVSVPRRGEWAGAFSVHSVKPRVWTDEEIALVVETAERTWDSVLHAMAENQVRAAAVRDGYLLHLTDALHDLQDEATIRDTAIRSLGEQLRVERALYCEVEGPLVTFHPEYVHEVLPIGGTFPATGFSLELDTLRADGTVVIDDVVTDPRLTT